MLPVAWMIDRSDTCRKPRIWARGVDFRVLGDEMAADPVPVRRPGVLVIGLEESVGFVGRSTGEETGSTNIGLKLKVNE